MEDEYLDIVDENDEVVGRASFQEVYEKSSRHRICHVFIFNDEGKMALQIRSKEKFFCPGCWSTSAGGHVQSGETYEQAALREFEEELGRKNEIEFLGKDYYGPKNKFLVSFRTVVNESFDFNKKEVESLEFFTIDEIRDKVERGEKFHPELLFLLEKYFF